MQVLTASVLKPRSPKFIRHSCHHDKDESGQIKTQINYSFCCFRQNLPLIRLSFFTPIVSFRALSFPYQLSLPLGYFCCSRWHLLVEKESFRAGCSGKTQSEQICCGLKERLPLPPTPSYLEPCPNPLTFFFFFFAFQLI